ncbi:hypothetical protein BRYFOR_05728 [Marvinbryantia formatexigens DSM 14469]|uniref:Uncharacterized protein n=1 Tax=Marvinbryantia formatexigens DSM 14469 TaxID=478749 RepID=C6LAT4_9FIRM|nr:hypothetical protein BRYFOR_05728 [Marvinbryantia formatexigens DSM 14469]
MRFFLNQIRITAPLYIRVLPLWKKEGKKRHPDNIYAAGTGHVLDRRFINNFLKINDKFKK